MKGDRGKEREHAQLWSLYFGMRAVEKAPEFLREAEEELRRYLEEGAEPAALPVGHLQLVN